MVIQQIIQIIHVLIPTTIRRPEACRISALANTVRVSDWMIIIATWYQFKERTNSKINLLPPPGAPVYISNPHFYLADPELLDAVVGLKPNQSIHESYFKIQPVSFSELIAMRFCFWFQFHIVCVFLLLINRNWASHSKEKCEYNWIWKWINRFI